MFWPHNWQKRLDAFYEERLSFQSDQLKILREIYDVKSGVQDQRIDILEARIRSLDGWVQTVSMAKGLGAPPTSGDSGFEDDYEEPIDYEADMSFEALFPSLFDIDAEEETVTETEVTDAE